MFRSATLISSARARYSKAAGTVFPSGPSRSARGFSLLELIIVMAISISIVAFATPTFLRAFYTIRLKSAASNLSGLMQQARIQAARRNAVITVKYRINANTQQAYIDFNNNDQWDAPEERLVEMVRTRSSSKCSVSNAVSNASIALGIAAGTSGRITHRPDSALVPRIS